MGEDRMTVSMPWTPEEFLALRRDEAGSAPDPTPVARGHAWVDGSLVDVHRLREDLASQTRATESLAVAANAVLNRWSELTSQEMYGELLRDGMDAVDFDAWELSHDSLRDAVRVACAASEPETAAEAPQVDKPSEAR